MRNLETYELDRLDTGVKVGTGMKSGFCFFDTTVFNLSLPGAPANAVYTPGTVCGQNNLNASNVRTGISVGWGDRYGATLRDQYIDVKTLTSGNYRLTATADLAEQFSEAREDNNKTWVDLSSRSARARAARRSGSSGTARRRSPLAPHPARRRCVPGGNPAGRRHRRLAAVPFTRRNLRRDVTDVGSNFDGHPELEFRLASKALELEQSGLSYQSVPPDYRFPYGHTHETQEEVFVVVDGSGRMKLDDEIVEVERWDVVRIPPGTWRGYEAGPDGLEILVFGAPNLGENPRDDVEGQRDWWTD